MADIRAVGPEPSIVYTAPNCGERRPVAQKSEDYRFSISLPASPSSPSSPRKQNSVKSHDTVIPWMPPTQTVANTHLKRPKGGKKEGNHKHWSPYVSPSLHSQVRCHALGGLCHFPDTAPLVETTRRCHTFQALPQHQYMPY